MMDGDSPGMLAHSSADDKQRVAIEALADCGKIGVDFRDAFIAAYGEPAWQKFNDGEHSPGDANASLQIPEGDIEEHLSQAKIEVSGRLGDGVCSIWARWKRAPHTPRHLPSSRTAHPRRPHHNTVAPDFAPC